MDLLIRAARRRHHDELADIGAPAARTIDAAGQLTTPAFVNAHAHLDKSMTRDNAPLALGDFQQALQSTLIYSDGYSVDEMME